MSSKNYIGLSFGVMAEDLKKQLEDQGYYLESNHLETAEKLRHASNILRIHQCLTDSQTDKVNHKILKLIIENIKNIEDKELKGGEDEQN